MPEEISRSGKSFKEKLKLSAKSNLKPQTRIQNKAGRQNAKESWTVRTSAETGLSRASQNQIVKSSVCDDKKKLKKIVLMCFNDQFLKAQEDRNERRLSVTQNKGDGEDPSHEADFSEANTFDFAFRKKAVDALNAEQKIMKKLDMHNYIEEMRKTETSSIFDFFKEINPDVGPRNMRLMYFYHISNKNVYSELTSEAIRDYKQDLVMTKIAKDERKFMYRGERQRLTDKIKKEYGRFKPTN